MGLGSGDGGDWELFDGFQGHGWVAVEAFVFGGHFAGAI